MQEGTFLKFIPPQLSGGKSDNKARYMLVVENDQNNNTVKMVNVSSLKGKEHKLLYSSNIEIKHYSPLPVPSFAKLDTLYTIDYFKELEHYVAFNNKTLGEIQFKFINSNRLKNMKEKEVEVIQFTENEFKRLN